MACGPRKIDTRPTHTHINDDRGSPLVGWEQYRDTPTHTHINNDRGSPIVHGLGAVGPEVGALSQVNVAGAKTGEGNINTCTF